MQLCVPCKLHLQVTVQGLMMLSHVFQGDIVLLSRGQPGPDSHEAVVLDFSSR